MFRRLRIPFRPAAGSSALPDTKSIFVMILIQGSSKFTMEDIADITPLIFTIRTEGYQSVFSADI